MSTISGLGSASGAWADASAMRQKMFNKVDSDGSGSVDKSELQTMLDKISEKTGNSVGSADDLLTKMDSNGDGSLDSTELESGMKSLMPPPKSTVDFAQQRTGEMGDMPPPPPPDAAGGASGSSGSSSSTSGSSSDSSSSSSSDPLDLNQDGVVSAQERAAGELKNLLSELTQVLQKALEKAYGDGGSGDSSSSTSSSSSSSSSQSVALTA